MDRQRKKRKQREGEGKIKKAAHFETRKNMTDENSKIIMIMVMVTLIINLCLEFYPKFIMVVVAVWGRGF